MRTEDVMDENFWQRKIGRGDLWAMTQDKGNISFGVDVWLNWRYFGCSVSFWRLACGMDVSRRRKHG